MDARRSPPWTAAEARGVLAQAPTVPPASLCGGGPVLVVAPHPDDESLGCGGLIALAAEAGLEVVVAVLTDGAASHPGSRRWPPARLAALRRKEAEVAVAHLSGGRARLRGFGAADGRLDQREGEALAWLGEEASPAAVFAPWSADPHPDHQAAARIAAAFARRTGATAYAYPVWGLILPDAAPAGPRSEAVQIDISAVLARKAEAVAAHRSQLGEVVEDDPDGFRLRPEDVARHLQPFERFFRLDPA